MLRSSKFGLDRKATFFLKKGPLSILAIFLIFFRPLRLKIHSRTEVRATKNRNMNIAIFASGGGSNARKIIEYFEGHASVKIVLVVSNKADAGVLAIADEFGIERLIISKSTLYDSEFMLNALSDCGANFIVLAGFLLLVPTYLVEHFDKKIVNIHPALLPKFGGKGMHGSHVHEAVRAANEVETGITIHFCNAAYDEGSIVFQASCPVLPKDSASDIARKVLQLEHQFFPKIIDALSQNPDFRQ
jgi:phosphoribosylglycinamide formyltransferase 1